MDDFIAIVSDIFCSSFGSFDDMKNEFLNMQQSLCAPSRNSMLTSRRPDTLHLYDVHSYWRDSVGNFTTLPEYFKLNGYETRSIGKIFHPGRSSNFTDDFPFSWSSPAFHPSTESFMNAAVCFNSVESILPRRNLICPVNIDNQPEQTLPDIQSIDEAQRLISKGFDKPYFIGVGLHKPHIPFRFPAEYLSYHDLTKFKNIQFDYLPNGLPIVAFNPYNDVRERDDMKASNISYPFGPIPHDLGWHIRQAYYASITYIDDLIGRLLNIVTLDDTIVVLTSDHGWSLGEHAEWAKYSNYETATRVPLIILAPGTKANIVRNVVELIDVFPTLVDLADLPPISRCNESELIETCTEGKSLVAHFELKLNRFDVFKESAISQYPRPGLFPTRQPNSDQPKLNEIKIMGYSIRTDQFRYTIWIRFDYKTFRRCKWYRIKYIISEISNLVFLVLFSIFFSFRQTNLP